MRIIYYQVRLLLAALNAVKVLSRGETIHKRMSGNPSFPNPVVPMTDLLPALVELQDAISNAANGDRGMIYLRDVKRNDVVNMLRALGSYVNAEAKGDKDIILSSGFEVRSEPVKHPVPDAPTKAEVVLAAISGAVIFKCKRDKFAKSYIAEWTVEGTENWQSSVTTGCRVSIDGLTPLTRYTFRMAAVNSKGQSNWSEEVSSLVL